MISGHSTPKLKDGIDTAATTTGPSTSNRGSGDNFDPGLDTPFLPPPASDIASSSHQYSVNPPESNVPDYSAARGVASNADYHSSIDENDIIIAYVFLELRLISLNFMYYIRVMGPTGAGKSSVSYLVGDSTL